MVNKIPDKVPRVRRLKKTAQKHLSSLASQQKCDRPNLTLNQAAAASLISKRSSFPYPSRRADQHTDSTAVVVILKRTAPTHKRALPNG